MDRTENSITSTRIKNTPTLTYRPTYSTYVPTVVLDSRLTELHGDGGTRIPNSKVGEITTHFSLAPLLLASLAFNKASLSLADWWDVVLRVGSYRIENRENRQIDSGMNAEKNTRALEEKLVKHAARLEALEDTHENKRMRKRALCSMWKIEQQLGKRSKPITNDEGNSNRPCIETGGTTIEQQLSGGGAKPSKTSANDADDEEEEEGNSPIEEKGGTTDGRNSSTCPVGTLSKKQLKNKVNLLNQDIKELAVKKQLNLAIKKFEMGMNKQYPLNIHTYTNLLNAYVRCNDMIGAEELITRFSETCIPFNMVLYTILLKGYAEIGDLSNMTDILFTRMGNSQILPEIRTLHTYLRGCTKIGAVEAAKRVLECNVPLDWVCIRELLCLVCHQCDVQYVIQFLSNSSHFPLKTNIYSDDHSYEKACIFMSISRVYLFIGDLNESMKWCQLCMKFIQLTKSKPLHDAMYNKHTLNTSIVGKKRNTSQIQVEDEDDGHTSNLTSSSMFNMHQVDELEVLAKAIQSKLVSFNGNQLLFHSVMPCIYIAQLSRLFSFSSINSTYNHSNCATTNSHNLSCTLSDNLNNNTTANSSNGGASVLACAVSDLVNVYGLAHALKSSPSLPSHPSLPSLPSLPSCTTTNTTHPSGSALSTTGAIGVFSVKQKLKAFMQLFLARFDSSECLDLHSVFSPHDSTIGSAIGNGGNDSAGEVSTNDGAMNGGMGNVRGRVVKLEIGSGDGDWVVAQAAAADATTSWIALEQRAYRVVNIITRAVLSDVHNLAILAGDASVILPQRLPYSSVSSVFVLHPEPPERVSGGGNNQGKHLLTAGFMRHIHAVLIVSGTLAIVSDNLKYLTQLATCVSTKLKSHFTSIHIDEEDGGASRESVVGAAGGFAGVTIWRGDLPRESGVEVRASSYFDRMWSRGQKKRRWFVLVRKV